MRILLVEDHAELSRWIARALEEARLTVECAMNGADADALLRRSQGNEAVAITCGALTFDTVSRMFTYGDALLALTPREHAVLEVLLTRAGRAVSKEKLFDEVFAFDDDANIDAIEIYIHRLRKKLERAQAGRVGITTLRGIGYLLEEKVQ